MTTLAVPIELSAEFTVTWASISSIKFVKWLQHESYEFLLPHGIYTGMSRGIPSKALALVLGATVRLAVMLVSPLHPAKAELPIEETEAGKVSVPMPLQPQNALLSIALTDAGMVSELMPLQP